jgi:hypothetical protein
MFANTSDSKVSTATVRGRDRGTADKSLTRNGAVASASAVATGKLSTLALRDGFDMADPSMVGVVKSSLPPCAGSVRYSTE